MHSLNLSRTIRYVRYFSAETKSGNVKPFEEIPGPKGIFGIGTFYKYLPLIGTQKWDELHLMGHENYSKYGPIVREKILRDDCVVWLFDPHDIAKVLNDTSPGIYPRRKSHLALQQFRKDRSHIYKSGGLLPTNGQEWWRLRSEFQKGLSSPSNVRNYLPDMDGITKMFVNNLPETKQDEDIPDFLLILARLNLELLIFLVFGLRMNCFFESEKSPKSKSSRLIEAAEVTNSVILPTDRLQLWRYFQTPNYRKLQKAQEFMESMAIEFVQRRLTFFEEVRSKNEFEQSETNDKSLLDEYLKNPNIDLSDIIGMAGDMLLAGIDTTTYTTCFVFYHLAKNPHVQEKLFKETCAILPNDSAEIDAAVFLNKATYARAILKESLRINPISVGVGRTLNSDLILSGYNVPKGTETVTQNLVACRLQSNFINPERFIPERWLKGGKSESNMSINPYLVLPFGHGMRACIARRLAEQNMLVLMIRIIRRFEVGWGGKGCLDIKTDLINKPDQSVKLTFELRK